MSGMYFFIFFTARVAKVCFYCITQGPQSCCAFLPQRHRVRKVSQSLSIVVNPFPSGGLEWAFYQLPPAPPPLKPPPPKPPPKPLPPKLPPEELPPKPPRPALLKIMVSKISRLILSLR